MAQNKDKTARGRSSKTKPMMPLLVLNAGGQVRELSLEEARDMLAQKPEVPEFSARWVGGILKKVRLIARPGEGKTELQLAIYLEDLALAPWVRYVVRMPGEPGIARCPQCGQWFVQSRPNQVYDSILHRERHRVTRWRASGGGKKKIVPDTSFRLTRVSCGARVPARISVSPRTPIPLP